MATGMLDEHMECELHEIVTIKEYEIVTIKEYQTYQTKQLGVIGTVFNENQ